MKQRIIALTAILATVGAVSVPHILAPTGVAQAADVNVSAWEIIESEEGLFRVSMPDEPQTRDRSTTILGNSINWTIVEADTPSSTYAVAYADLSPDFISDNRGAADAFMQDLGTAFDIQELVEQGRSTSWNIYPSREYVKITDGENVESLRLILVDNRLYGLYASDADVSNISHFQESFQSQPVWQTFQPEDGSFSVSAPASLQFSLDEAEVAEGRSLEWSMYRGSSPRFTAGDPDYFAVAHVDLDSSDLDEGAEDVLARVSDRILIRLGLAALASRGRPITVQGNPGIEFVSSRYEQVITVRFLLVDQRIYGLFVASDELGDTSRFVESFQVQ